VDVSGTFLVSCFLFFFFFFFFFFVFFLLLSYTHLYEGTQAISSNDLNHACTVFITNSLLIPVLTISHPVSSYLGTLSLSGGGSMENIPCSHVGHVYRNFDRFGVDPALENVDVGKALNRNDMRVAEVWMDEYKKLFYDVRRFTFLIVFFFC
jgi:hypothetical protein